MKRWKKWSLGIFGILTISVLVLIVLFWPSIRILLGSGGISGELDTIPKPTSSPPEPLTKGAADWTSWLGPNSDNRSLVTGIITDWSQGLEKVWEAHYLCQGSTSGAWSAPAIQGNRLTVPGRSEDSDLLFCLDPTNGRLIWETSYPAESTPSHGSGPRATPFIDGDRVYTFGRSGDLVCWSLFDGEKLWHKNVADEGGESPQWGYASSPLVLDNRVIVQGGASAGVIAFDNMTGDVIWKQNITIAGYAAIRAMNRGGDAAILAFHGKGLAALNAADGTELWNSPWETPYDVNATTPLIIDDTVFITSGYKTGGTLLRVTDMGVETVWKNDAIASHHSDSYAIDGYLYGYSGDSQQNRGAFKCVRLSDGAEQWSTNDMGWGTCSYVDGYLLCLDIKGNIFLMKPDPSGFVKISEMKNALGDIKGPVWTKPVIANGLLYLRFKQTLICYRLTK